MKIIWSWNFEPGLIEYVEFGGDSHFLFFRLEIPILG